MCGRYSLTPEESLEIAKIVEQLEGRVKLGEIYPANAVPVLLEAGGRGWTGCGMGDRRRCFWSGCRGR